MDKTLIKSAEPLRKEKSCIRMLQNQSLFPSLFVVPQNVL